MSVLPSAEALLSVKELNVSFKLPEGVFPAVNDVSLDIYPKETLAIIGESGSGKSQLFYSLLQLCEPNAIVRGSAKFKGTELINLPQTALNKIRGSRISIVFQDPMTALNPYYTVGNQLIEVLQVHKPGFSYDHAYQESVEFLQAVRIPEAKKRMSMYPQEFSGGMRQRVLIAMALLCRPELLIADEPSTALDVTTQAEILSLLKDLQGELQLALALITHDLGVVASMANRIVVMYAGRIMESAETLALFENPRHPYTRQLMAAIPSMDVLNKPLKPIEGNPPPLMQIPKGCPFAPRCQLRRNSCSKLQFDSANAVREPHYSACPL